MVGFPTIEEMVTRRQFQYLGHLGRYAEDRIETKMLNAWLYADGDRPPKRLRGARTTLRYQYWKLISDLMQNTDFDQDQWPEQWRNVAQSDKGRLWKSLSEIEKRKIVEGAE